MAARESYASDRRQSGGYSSARSKAGQAYMYGNVVAKPEYEPKKNRSSVKRRKKVSRQVQKNRNRALHMNAAYVVFLTIAATIVLLLCVNYVRLQSELTKHSKNVTALQEERAAITAAAEKRSALLARIAAGENVDDGNGGEGQQRVLRNFKGAAGEGDNDDKYGSMEYRKAFMKLGKGHLSAVKN